jgi:hypothetical protein
MYYIKLVVVVVVVVVVVAAAAAPRCSYIRFFAQIISFVYIIWFLFTSFPNVLFPFVPCLPKPSKAQW